MTSYRFDAFDQGHILVLTMLDTYNVHTDMCESTLALIEMIDKGPDRVVIISDSRELRIKDVNDMLVAASNVRTEESKRLVNHPKVIKNFSVMNNKMMQTAVKGLNTATFGFFPVTIFETPEAAIDAARAVLAQGETVGAD